MSHKLAYFTLIHLLFHTLCVARLIWKNDIQIRSSDFEEDLEQIPSKLLASLGLLVDMNKMERFDSLANSQPEVGEEYREVPLKEYDYQIDYGEDYEKNPSRKRLAEEKQDYDTTEKTFINGSFIEFDYDLEEFKKDYENSVPEVPEMATVLPLTNMSVVENDTADDRPFEPTEIEEYSKQCLDMPLWMYFFFGIPCLVHETRNVIGEGKIENIIIFGVKTSLLFFPSTFLLVLGLWCYDGMFSILFPFEFFHPYRGIIRIRHEANRIPPGVFIDENGVESKYNPSRAEVKAYEELMRLIRS